jgi:hypothetical protein
MISIFHKFPISNDEYNKLSTNFDDLCKFIAWQLIRKNKKNNLTDEWQDIAQEIRIAVMRAGSYYKRQCYIEECLNIGKVHAKDKFISNVMEELEFLWKNKTKHGANKQCFGEHQENILNNLVAACVPVNERPDPNRPLVIDKKFDTYCKAIAWNCQRSLGRKITRERSIRSGIVSLSNYDHIGSLKVEI